MDVEESDSSSVPKPVPFSTPLPQLYQPTPPTCRRRRPKILPVLIVVGGVSDPRLAPQAIAHFVNCDES